MWNKLKLILPYVEKPARYVGNEINSVEKEQGKVELRFALAFPDVYEIGFSYMGFHILYEIINDIPWAQAERVFAPWPDMEAKMREHNLPLYGLETKTPLHTFDIIGFTLQYELGYTNILNMLDLAGLSPYAPERSDFPLVLAGGPGAMNPEPLADFIDAFVLGEGEEIVLEIAETVKEARKGGLGKEDTLAKLAAIPGIYVPKFYSPAYDAKGVYRGLKPLGDFPPLKKRIVKDFGCHPLPRKLVVPLVQPVHDRVSIEICRGCARGCRFCQAGMLYRPVRERPRGQLAEQGMQLLQNTGSSEVSLSSLSSADYSQIEELVKDLMASEGTSVSLPSLRVDSFSVELARLTKAVRKTGLTLAPEAGSQRLRDVINKNVSEADIFNAARKAFENGWDSLKLYFMLGLPTETDEDIVGIIRLVRGLERLYRETRGKKGRLKISVAVSTFVPKPHTPFQWEALLERQEVERRQRLLLDNLRPPLYKVQTSDWEESKLEAMLARGDRRLGRAIFLAWQKGCRFDAWSEHFRPRLWEEAFDEAGIDVGASTGEIPLAAVLPWDHIDIGVSKDYLLGELAKAKAAEVTRDCTFADCSRCGVCGAFAVKPLKRGGKAPCD